MKGNLREVLNSLEKGELVSIGCIDGCNYVYIGPKDNTEDILKAFQVLLERSQNYLNRNERELKRLKNMTLGEYGSLKRKVKSKESLENLYKYDLDRHERSIERYKEFIDNYVDPFERMVIEYDYIKKFTDGSRVIIVEGLEQGNYWYLEEYEKDH